MKRIIILTWILWSVYGLRLMAQTEQSVHINEVQPCNLDQFLDPSWNYGSWVEICNSSDADVQLRGYWVSDDREKLRKVRITQSTIVPAGGFRNLWFDHHSKYCLSQLDMKLDPEGGVFYLSRATGEVVDSVAYPPIAPRASYARTADGAGEWQLSAEPSPQRSNEGMTFATTRLEAPMVMKESQIFDGSLTFSVGIPAGCTLRYTTDGSTPTLSNGLTSSNGYFKVSTTTVYRFALFRKGYLSSPVVTRSFLLRDKSFTLPVISVTTAPENLYSDSIGIFVKGTNGRAGRGQSSPCNWNMDWDRPCNFELLSADGESLVNQEAEILRCGGWSRAYTPYSFKIHSTKFYEGRKTLDYPFFPAKPFLKHKMLQIRNGGNDNSCRVKDAFLQQVVATSGLDVDYQEYQPVAHYLNGVYKGVINMREPNNKHFVYANYGLDDDEIDLFEIDADSGYVQMCGSNVMWKRLYTYSRLASSQTYYDKVCEMLDIDEFCNYIAVFFYVGCTDWPQNNLKGFRPIAEGGRFRFIIYDLDHSFGTASPFTTFEGKKTHTFNTLYGEPVSNYTKEIEVVTIFLNLLNNAKFRKQFIDTFCLVAGSVFEPSRCEEIMRSLAERVYDMQILSDNGYGRNASPWGTTNSMINSLSTRQSTLINSMKNYSRMQLSSVTGQEISLSSNLPVAKLMVNDQIVPTGNFSGTLFPPVTLKAVAPSGYRFLGWRDISADTGKQEMLVEEGSQWRYYDKGSLDGQQWTANDYADGSWSQGAAPLGYSNSQTIATRISYGSNSSQKHPAYYFRRTFNIGETIDEQARFHLSYHVDDGMVVYVNGVEACRHNMPSGTITGTTFSSTYAENIPFTGTIELPRGLFRQGENVIAVEVHNNSYTSSDIYWDAKLFSVLPVRYDEDFEYLSDEAEFTMPTTGGHLSLKACFERIPSESGEGVAEKKVVINEVSAANSIYVNEYFKKNDWVELYNMTSEDINLEGFYLSDDAKNPCKCIITAQNTQASTILPAHGFKIIWCDKLASESQLHADFKLANADGQMVILTSPDQSYADTLAYCIHDGLQTVGRFPDGGENLYLMTKPTIGKENVMNSYTTRYEPDDSGNVDGIGAARASGLSIAYGTDELLIKNEENTPVSFHVFTVSGMTVMSGRIDVTQIHASVPLSPLKPGIYVARVEDEDGNQCTVKFKK